MPMRGALKVTYIDGTEEYYEVDPIGDNPDLAENLKIFLTSPHLTLVLPNEILIVPSTSIRHISVTRSGTALPEAELDAIPGVFLGANRIIG
jgi:hypothetical protein